MIRQQVADWGSHLSKIRDESIIVVGKTQKLLDSLDILRYLPIGNCSNLILIHMYLP